MIIDDCDQKNKTKTIISEETDATGKIVNVLRNHQQPRKTTTQPCDRNQQQRSKITQANWENAFKMAILLTLSILQGAGFVCE